MGVYELSNKAKEDLAKTYEYGIENFGLKQSQKYLNGLHKLFLDLSNNKDLGRAASRFLPLGLKRFPYESHTIYYLPIDKGIFIVRVLGQKMDSNKHLS